MHLLCRVRDLHEVLSRYCEEEHSWILPIRTRSTHCARVSDFMERYVYPNVQVFRDQVAASGNPHLDMLCLICGSRDTQDDECKFNISFAESAKHALVCSMAKPILSFNTCLPIL